MANKDPYEILGVSRNATQDEIKRAYRRLAKEHHPDRNQGDKAAEQRFKEIHAAYEVLGDKDRRAQYDRFGAGGPRPEYQQWSHAGEGGPFGGGGGGGVQFDFDSIGDLSSIFEQFFSRGGRGGRRATSTRTQRAAPKGGDIEHSLDIGFLEAINGTTREVLLSNGRGKGNEHIEVRIPAGVSDGQRIRVRGRGQDGPGGRGDLMIRCRVQSHPYYRREGLNLLVDLPLTFTEAALGAKVDVPTPDGTTVVTIPPGTSSGAKLRLRERGVRDGRTGGRGDLLVVVKIVAPRELAPKARELLESLANELNENPRTNWPT